MREVHASLFGLLNLPYRRHPPERHRGPCSGRFFESSTLRHRGHHGLSVPDPSLRVIAGLLPCVVPVPRVKTPCQSTSTLRWPVDSALGRQPIFHAAATRALPIDPVRRTHHGCRNWFGRHPNGQGYIYGPTSEDLLSLKLSLESGRFRKQRRASNLIFIDQADRVLPTNEHWIEFPSENPQVRISRWGCACCHHFAPNPAIRCPCSTTF